ncbi:SoxR reducing system RseC family protein [Natranaerobius trueperi]|uniref:Fis family transcriptional regulator n=1 Tax=Natranaerobius trueperi TaxID=759412 RepID=A0A226BVS8_9FIRM|nr:SoxR reducing system RseC family protein [Natranaerobius trueperi]OWZ83148.1 hypothetical protein CDO51_10295 [Natranaerobius trueperi]
MAVKSGRVMKISDDEILVLIQNHSTCSKCGACSDGKKSNENTIWAKDNKNAEVGDFVEIEIPEKNLLKVSILLYLVPIIFLLIGIIIGQKFAEINNLSENSVGLISGVFFMGLSYLGINIIDRRIGESDQVKPKIRSIIKYLDN